MCSPLYRFLPRLFTPLLLLTLVATVPAQATEQIASAGGTLTDIIFALGAEDKLVAVDTSSTSPAAAASKASIGYYRSLSAEALIATGATSLWALEGSGPEATLTQLANTGITVKRFSKPRDLPEFYQFIAKLGQLLHKDEAAEALISQIKQSLPELPAEQAGAKPASALFILQASSRGIVVAGDDTVPALLFSHSAIQNLAKHSGFKPISAEFLLLNQPDLLVVPDHVAQSAGGLSAFCQLPELRLLQAAKDCRVLVMDSLMSMGMTSRIGEAVQQLYQFRQHAVR
ncbi:heme/hemin ABC transporter substrate-binding protein [Alishewanella longhuensis]